MSLANSGHFGNGFSFISAGFSDVMNIKLHSWHIVINDNWEVDSPAVQRLRRAHYILANNTNSISNKNFLLQGRRANHNLNSC